ncbi:DUF6192 family protein [Amycolatopsis sp. cg5]|uniref:DUF6192 family protein n=1 Tax=Amycolatopsis sp. cg5 TaxID=3238802 RepID=UPI00352459D3
MVSGIGHVTKARYELLLDRAIKAIESVGGHQFELGDIALEIEPMNRVGEAGGGVYDTLRTFADDIGVEFSTLLGYRMTAAAWPSGKRRLDLGSFTVHRTMAHLDRRFQLIKKPTLNPRTRRRYWRVDDAARLAGRTPKQPESRQEKVAKVHDLVRDTEVAATVATNLLHRPEVASKAMADHTARRSVNTAQFERAREVRHKVEKQIPAARKLRYSIEVTQLIGGCNAFVAVVNRALPMLRENNLTDAEEAAVGRYLVKVRAAADWCQTSLETGDASMDEQLAQLLGEE